MSFAAFVESVQCGAHLWLPLPDGDIVEGYCAEYLPHPPGAHVPRTVDLVKWRSQFKSEEQFRSWLTKLAEGDD